MQARRSSLYRKVEETGFVDDFTTQTNGAFLHGTTASDGSGVWEDAAYTTDRIIKDPTVSTQRVIPQNSNLNFCICHPKPPGEFAGETRLRCYTRCYIKHDAIFLSAIAGSGLWATNSRTTGVNWYTSKSTANLYAEVVLKLNDDTKYSSQTIGIVNAWVDWELHAEKLSETSVKVGLKMNTAWIYGPTVHTVTAGFFAVPNKAQLICRDGTGFEPRAFIDSIIIDNQVDW